MRFDFFYLQTAAAKKMKTSNYVKYIQIIDQTNDTKGNNILNDETDIQIYAF